MNANCVAHVEMRIIKKSAPVIRRQSKHRDTDISRYFSMLLVKNDLCVSAKMTQIYFSVREPNETCLLRGILHKCRHLTDANHAG